MSQTKRKVMVLGLDGATFDIIDPLRERHQLPHLSALMDKGSRAPLKSSVMPNSYPAWASITTGVNPGKHGIFWSLIKEADRPEAFRLMNAMDIGAKKIWDILGENGQTVGIINIPTEYPPCPVHGFLICGALTPDVSSEYTYPAGLKEELLKIVPDYQCEIEYGLPHLDKLARQILGSIQNREKVILHLLQEKPWDFFFAVFTETDIAQHRYWAGIDARHPDHARFKSKYGQFIFDIYRRLDTAIGRILEQTSEETAVFVISDHGFGPFYQSFSLPRWLVDEGYLVLKGRVQPSRVRDRLGRSSFGKKARLWKAAISAHLSHLKSESTVRRVREHEATKAGEVFQTIDWDRTRAFFTQDYGVRLNVKGREPSGTVPPGEEESRLKKEIQQKLGRLKFSNGRDVFEAVLTKEEAFSGPFLGRAPDLVVPINYSQAPPRPEAWPYSLTHPTLSGTHAPRGIFIAQGPGIKKAFRLKEIPLVDLAPTILYYLDAPLTEDMDGKVLLDIFEPNFRENKRILKKGSSLKPLPKREKKCFTNEESQQIEQKLRSLGYID
jgi:predicted AlkP superfamily phosphohydrolase/phosphomutase